MEKDDKLLDTDFNLVIGSVLKKKRMERGWSLTELSKRIDKSVSRQTLHNYETGATKIRRNMFVKLCEVFGESPDDVLDEIVWEYNKEISKK